jgi:hypothetical protein
MAEKNWYKWESQGDFDAWHNNVIESLGLPRAGTNLATGEEQLNAQWTTSYTALIQIANDDYRALVESDKAITFAVGLGELSEAPPLPDWL